MEGVSPDIPNREPIEEEKFDSLPEVQEQPMPTGELPIEAKTADAPIRVSAFGPDAYGNF